MKIKVFFSIICIGVPLAAMDEANEYTRLFKPDIEAPAPIPLRPLAMYCPAQKFERKCIIESESYDEFLDKVNQIAEPHQTTIKAWIKDETEKWEAAINAADQAKIHALFNLLSRTVQYYCKARATPIFTQDTQPMGSSRVCRALFLKPYEITHRSISPNLKNHVRSLLSTNNLKTAQDLHSNFKKWSLYFDYFNKLAQTRENIQTAKTGALGALPVAMCTGGLISQLYGHPLIAILLASCATVADAAYYTAICKLDLLSMQQAMCIQDEIDTAHQSLRHYTLVLEREEKMIQCIDLHKQAMQIVERSKQRPPDLEISLERLKTFYKADQITEFKQEARHITATIKAYIAQCKVNAQKEKS